VQEALTASENILYLARHAGASSVCVRLQYSDVFEIMLKEREHQSFEVTPVTSGTPHLAATGSTDTMIAGVPFLAATEIAMAAGATTEVDSGIPRHVSSVVQYAANHNA